ncbi:MAG: acetylglutamate kinase [Bacillota bacterium]|nr:acetylglutamate kinase [Bacillota bacterium]
MTLEVNTISIDLIPLIQKYRNKTFVIKYGGSIMENTEAQKAFLNDAALLKSLGINIIIVHGGGPEINKWLKKTNIESKFINGLRVTDEATMEIVEMVLSGNINKKLSSALSSLGINAIGISGRDSNLINARKKYACENNEQIDLGCVGEVSSVNKDFLLSLINCDELPVISPVGGDEEGNIYNINADYAAASISSALGAEKLIIMTDIDGVYKDINDKSSLINSLTLEDIKEYIEAGIIKGGMIPKLTCCADAIVSGTKNVHLIDGRKLHSLILDTFTESGTKIMK